MLSLGAEIVWIVVIIAFAGACSYPLYHIITPDFLSITFVLGMLFAFYFRLVIFFKQTAWLKFLALQILLFLFNPALFFKLLSKIQEMIYLFDAYDPFHFSISGTSFDAHNLNNAFQLFRKEFLLFSVGLLILIVLTEFRILMAFVKRIKEMD